MQEIVKLIEIKLDILRLCDLETVEAHNDSNESNLLRLLQIFFIHHCTNSVPIKLS